VKLSGKHAEDGRSMQRGQLLSSLMNPPCRLPKARSPVFVGVGGIASGCRTWEVRVRARREGCVSRGVLMPLSPWSTVGWSKGAKQEKARRKKSR